MTFDHLADPAPPRPGDDERGAVRRRATAFRRRRRQRLLGVGCVVGVVITVGAVALTRDASTQRVATSPSPSTTTPMSPGDAVTFCFGPLGTDSGKSPADTLARWPSGLAPLLAVDSEGRLWVVRDGVVEQWTAGHEGPSAVGVRWARWAPDGSIYASRLVDRPAVEIDRFTGPGQASEVFDLPYTVSAAAPTGTCPIDGDLETFALGTQGFIFARHVPGPIPHSCPPGAPPSSCESPEGTTFERRSLTGQSIGDLGEFAGQRVRLGGESADGSWIIQQGPGRADVHHVDATPSCCFGGLSGQAFALSADGSQLAAVDGATVSVAPTGPAGVAAVWFVDQQPLGAAMAWTSETLAIARGDGLALLSASSGDRTIIDDFVVGTITCLDFATT